MKISQVVLWTDVGFMEGSLEVPSLKECRFLREDNVPRGAIASYTDVTPSKGRWFTEFKLKGSYTALKNAGYLRMKYDGQFYFGWVDSVELLSDTKIDTTDFSEVLITWHIDQWRTYLLSAVFGYGNVVRRARSDNDPPQTVSCRYKLPGEFRPLEYSGPGSNLDWVILTYVSESSDHKVTECRTMVFPVDHTSTTTRHYLKINGQEASVQCPSLADIINGDYDELYGLSSAQISSVFIVPYPPLAVDRVEGTTVYLATASTGTSSEYITTPITTLPVYLTSFEMYGENYWQDIYVNWADSEGNSGRAGRFSSFRATRDWLRSHQGKRDQYTYCTVNGTRTYWREVHEINAYINACLGNQYTPTQGDSFRISKGYYNVTFTEETDTEYTTTLTGTFGTDLLATYSDGSWHFGDNNMIAFTEPPQCWFIHLQGSESFSVNLQTSRGGFGFAYSGNGNYPEQTIDITPITTTDTKEWLFTDMSGSVIGSVPWGLTVSHLTARLIANATSAYIEFREDIDSHTKGTCYTVPLPAVDVTSNSWSDYVYSGSRDADIENKRIAREQALTSGLLSSLSGGAQGAMLGGLKESGFVGSDRQGSVATRASIGHAGLFGALGAGAGIAGAVGDYALAGYYNDQLQGVADVQSAKQFDSITTPGSGWDWLWHGRKCGFISIVGDNYSIDRFAASVDLNGIEVSEPTADCTSLVEAGGPLRISDLVVLGPIPSEAKSFIKGRLSDGVRLVTKSEVEELATYTLQHREYNHQGIWAGMDTGYILATSPDNTIPGATLTFEVMGGALATFITGTPEVGSYFITVRLSNVEQTGLIRINVIEG